MHEFWAASYRIHGAGLYAKGAAYASGFVYYGDAPRLLVAASGIKRLVREVEERG
jgi:hypothetical protein